MKDVMLDLETLSTGNNAVILQIGACYFDRITGEIGDTFCVNIDIASSIKEGFSIDADTLKWWFKQDRGAKKSVIDDGVSIQEALTMFNNFVHPEVSIWSHSTFDYTKLENYYFKTGITPVFSFRSSRDIRTIVDLANITDWSKYPDVGIHHNALDDCLYQVNYVVDCLNKLR